MSTSVEETLAHEAEKRPRAATIAVAGGLFTVGGNLLFTLISAGAPTADDGIISLPGALNDRLAGNEPQGPSLVANVAAYFGENAILLCLSAVLSALAFASLAYVMLFLYRATAARGENVGRLAYYALLAGLVLAPLGTLLFQIPQWLAAADYESGGARTAEAARDALATPIVGIGQLISQLGVFPLAVGVVLVALNAMRVGLLTRFFGVLGIIAGVLTLIPGQFDQPGVIRGFFLIGVGLIIAGRMKVPPAWLSGRAEPWPTQQQLREQREAARGADAEKAPAPAAAERPAELRKKRKRRR